MSDYDDLCTVLAPFGQFNIASRYPFGIPLSMKIDALSFSFDGPLTVPSRLLDGTTPRDARQYLLSRYEALLSALRAARFVLSSAPRLTFDGYLNPAVWTIGGDVAINEHEECISAQVDIDVVRCGKRMHAHGHNEEEVNA